MGTEGGFPWVNPCSTASRGCSTPALHCTGLTQSQSLPCLGPAWPRHSTHCGSQAPWLPLPLPGPEGLGLVSPCANRPPPAVVQSLASSWPGKHPSSCSQMWWPFVHTHVRVLASLSHHHDLGMVEPGCCQQHSRQETQCWQLPYQPVPGMDLLLRGCGWPAASSLVPWDAPHPTGEMLRLGAGHHLRLRGSDHRWGRVHPL